MSDRIGNIDDLIKEIDGVIVTGKATKPKAKKKILVPALAALLTFSGLFIYNKTRSHYVAPATMATASGIPAPAAATAPKAEVKQEPIRVVQRSLEPFYFVERKNTLSGIARDLYMDIKVWHEIYELNKGTIDNPNLIYINQPLRLPREPTYSTNFVKAAIVSAKEAAWSFEIPDRYYKLSESESKLDYEAAFKAVAANVTGDENNWQKIIDYNLTINQKFDKYSLDTGMHIFVPKRLVVNENCMAKIPSAP
jgi:LysM repeat protein